MKRRLFLQSVAACAAALGKARGGDANDPSADWTPRYLLASCLYGTAPLTDILPEVANTGSHALDLWPRPHGDQREQLAAMGVAEFAELLAQHAVSLGCITQYPLGPFGLADEMKLAKQLGCNTIVTGSKGPAGLSGLELKEAVQRFSDQLQPHLQLAEQAGVTIAIENHSGSLIHSPDSIKWLLELCPHQALGIALAPYHLPQDAGMLAGLIRHCEQRLTVLYAWQHGLGCMEKLPKEQELLQLPGRGPLDFAPLMRALAECDYAGWVSIFMHPVPRGIPILPTISEVTGELNRARHYLASLTASADSHIHRD